MSAYFTSANQVPADVDYLADGNDVIFVRDNESFDAWFTRPALGHPMQLSRLFEVFGDLREAKPCERCSDVVSTGKCCSSHKKELCHRCYRRTHFVEICSAACSKCTTEGIDPLKQVFA